MTTATPATPAPTEPPWTRWLYRILAITGIAVGIFIIVAGLYLLIAQPGHKTCCDAKSPTTTTSQTKDDKSCCASMKDAMKNMPSMPPMSPMPSMSPMPTMPMPTPGR